MRHDDDPSVERLQLALEPFEALDVEVVRRLVEEQQVGIAAERRASDARVSSPPEKLVERPLEIGVDEKPRSASRESSALAPGVASGMLEASLRLRVAAQRRRAVIARCHRLLEPAELLLGCGEVAAPERT